MHNTQAIAKAISQLKGKRQNVPKKHKARAQLTISGVRTPAQCSKVPAGPNNRRCNERWRRDWILRNDERDPRRPGDSRVIERVPTELENIRTCLDTQESSNESGRSSKIYVRAWRLESHRTSPDGVRESTYVYTRHPGIPRDQNWEKAHVKWQPCSAAKANGARPVNLVITVSRNLSRGVTPYSKLLNSEPSSRPK